MQKYSTNKPAKRTSALEVNESANYRSGSVVDRMKGSEDYRASLKSTHDKPTEYLMTKLDLFRGDKKGSYERAGDGRGPVAPRSDLRLNFDCLNVSYDDHSYTSTNNKDNAGRRV
jgi:hypothetical protein